MPPQNVLRGRSKGTCTVIRVALLVRAKYVVGALQRVMSVLLLDRLVGPAVKVSGSRAADPAEVLHEGLYDLNKTFIKVQEEEEKEAEEETEEEQ